ncbi:hypothetical protein [Streptomyces sp. NPDC059753]|uniref:deoxynucleotide monophosphate kinase family protein n=1 Tax=Streptomyces sp. NPDC059753 TaxID=3346933 RepID=UPI00365D9D38
MGNIGIIGRARVGKDTAGKWLVDNRGYRRVAFADPLKQAALKLDPIVEVTDYGDTENRLSDVLRMPPVVDFRHPISNVDRRAPWERAKDEVPEIRRILQELGAAIRAIDPEFWLRAALTKVTAANEAGVPCVITDVRYPNEAESLRRAGFHLIYIDRPGVPQLDHESEGSLKVADAHHYIDNSGDLAKLRSDMEVIANYVTAFESRRHANRL